jgi:gliding motility associated protien GldN
MKRIVWLFVSFVGLSLNLSAQTTDEQPAGEGAAETNPYGEVYNPNSVTPIPESHILIRNRIWRHIDLKEKLNKPLFPHKGEITGFIMEGVEGGFLTPYSDEDFQQPMTKKEFFENLKLPEGDDQLSEEEKALGFGSDDDWNDGNQGSALPKAEKTAEYFLPKQVSILEIMEDWIFDKVRSQQVYDIQSIKLIIPEDQFETGLRREVGIFKYKDLAAYFDEKGISWINVNNGAGHIKMTEAFDLRRFSSKIIKIENPDDNAVSDIYNDSPKASIKASKQLEEELLEKEYFMWEP